MSVNARLGGKPLLSEPAVHWELSSGVKPFEGRFSVIREDAESLLGGPLSPVSLEIDDGEGRSHKYDYLYVLAKETQENPYVTNLLVVDRRWFWSFRRVSAAFNVRRVVGSKRRIYAGGNLERQPLTPLIAYHPASLKIDQPWTAREVLEFILHLCFGAENQSTGYAPSLTFDGSFSSQVDDLPIEDLEVEDAADDALARALAFLPQAAVSLDAKGQVHVYSSLDGRDAAYAEEGSAPIVGEGYPIIRSNSRLRPSKIHVLFTREHELRFDFLESGNPTTSEDERYCQNVIPVPDFSLTLKSEDVVDEGTWISLVDALDAWGAPPRQSHLSNATSWLTALRRIMVPYLDLWTGIGLSGIRDPDANWARRIGAIQQHYRRTWRISPRWMARIRQLKSSLVATLDPTTGTRAPAMVFADYSRLSSMRSLWLDVTSGQDAVYAINVKSYPKTLLLKDGTPAPADVQILDSDQGIISMVLRPDPLGIYQSLLPGMLSLEGSGEDSSGRPTNAGPTWDIEDVTRPISFNAIAERHKAPELTPVFRAAFLLTAVPAPSNSFRNGHLYRYTVEPKDVMEAQMLPPSLNQGIFQSHGPELEIRIGPTVETARVAWRDEASEAIESSFGLSGAVFAGPELDPLVVNLEDDADGAGSLKAIAYAVAARTWAALTDRYQGSKGVPLDSNIRPAGFADRVSTDITPGGAVLTHIYWKPRIPEMDLFALLPDSTRRIVLRLAPSTGKQL